MNKLERMLQGVNTAAVICSQWGDTGKGKIVDLLAEWADVIARGTGADNAGHTIWVQGKKYVMHLIPSGILHDGEGKINIIGSGVAVNPRVVLEEMAMISEAGLSYDHLMIALNAKLILPQHILLDRLRESKTGKIGTTGRGVGPVYADHYARMGLIVNDMLNPASFREKFKRNLREKMVLLKEYDPVLIQELMHHEHLEKGLFFSDGIGIFDVDAIVERYVEYGRLLRDLISDTDTLLKRIVGTKKVLLEGAQGTMLSVDHGSYPYVTSSDCTDQGLAHGVGLKDKHIDLVLNIAKACYMTRVGGGPFPTEIGGHASADWCAESGVNRRIEKDNYPFATVNSQQGFLQGIAIRMAGDEYGATTGRPRRVGWLDLPVLRYATRQCGRDVILTKLDVLSGCETIKICSHYQYVGEPFNYGADTIDTGYEVKVAIPFAEVMDKCEPVYAEFPGWCCDISAIREYDELPIALKEIVAFIEKQTDVRVRIISVGADRDATIIL
ncbi:adenylosuccinate synthase [Candidatus Falkowbacteria bacterium]|nr:adenylosuccinate synthase [Candidatus Falkowbacteria bacterium]